MEDVLKECKFFDFPSNVIAEVLTGRTISVCADDLLFRPTSDSARRFIGSGGLSTVCVSSTGSVVSRWSSSGKKGVAMLREIAWAVRSGIQEPFDR